MRGHLGAVDDRDAGSLRTASEHPRKTQYESGVAPALNRFVGRDAELEHLGELLQHAQHVSVIGPAGIGKSRLVEEFFASGAQGLTDPASAIFVSLSSETSSDGFLVGVAEALGTRSLASAQELADTLEILLSDGSAWLVLDGMDDLASCSEWIARWLSIAPTLRIVSTSREPLGDAAECVLELGGLPSEDAVDLLEDRLERLGNGAPRVEGQDLRFREVAQRFDGVPYALELSAALLQPRSSARLDGIAGDRNALESALASAWSALSALLQDTLTRCAALPGAFEVDSIRLPEGAELSIEEAVKELRMRGLVRGTGSRASVPACVTEFVRTVRTGESLLDLTAQAAVTTIVRAFTLAESAEEGDVASLRRLAADLPRLRLAIQMVPDRERRLQGLVALLPLLERGLGFPEGALAALLESMPCARLPEGSSSMRARACLALGALAEATGRPSEGVKYLKEAVASSQGSNDLALEARCLAELGRASSARGQRQEAIRSLQTALEIAERASSSIERARAHERFAQLFLSEGRPKDAQRHLRGALACYQGAQNGPGAARAETALAHVELALGHTAEARSHATEGEQRAIDADDTDCVTSARFARAAALHIEGHLEEATRGYATILRLLGRAGHPRGRCRVIGHLGIAHGELGNLAAARKNLKRARSLAQRCGDTDQVLIWTAQLASLETEAGNFLEADELMRQAHAEAAQARPSLASLLALLEHACRAGRSVHAAAQGDQRLAASLKTAALEGWEKASKKQGQDARTIDESLEHRFAWRLLSRLLDKDPLVADQGTQPRNALLVDKRGRWFSAPSGEPIELGGRATLRRILVALTARRIEQPGIPLSKTEIVNAAWPSEFVLERAAANRIRVAIATLRGMGLEVLIQTHTGGYRLNPDVEVVWIGNDEPARAVGLSIDE